MNGYGGGGKKKNAHKEKKESVKLGLRYICV